MALEHAAPGELVDLRPLGDKLPQAASTALFRTNQLEVMRMVLHAGKSVPEHQVAGEVTIQCMEGAVELKLPTATLVMRPGHFVYLAGNTAHALHAMENASLLVTISRVPAA